MNQWVYRWSEFDLQYAAKLASDRQNANAVAGVPTRKISKQSDTAIHFDGALGEVAAFQILGLPVPSKVMPGGMGGDGGYDALDFYGWSWSVKACRPPGRCYILPDNQTFKADIGLLVQVSDTDAEILAWISREVFGWRSGRRDNLPGYWLDKSRMFPREALERIRAENRGTR